MNQTGFYSSQLSSSLAMDQSSQRILNFLARASLELGSSLNWQETIDQLCRIVCPDIAEHCSIWWINADGKLAEQKKPATQVEISDLIEMEVLQVRESGISRVKKNADSYFLTVPMRLNNEVTGFIMLINFQKAFDQVDVVLTEELGHRAAMVLDHAQVYENLKTAEAHLQKMRDMADVASQTKSLFLANMSHEIRTPLSAILGFLDLILSNQEQGEAAGPTRWQQHELAERVKANGAHLLRLIDQILDLSKIESGKIEIFAERINLGELLKEVYNTVSLQAEKKKIKLEFKLTSAVPVEVNSDPTRLKQILINIICNAIKFTERGSVSLAVSINQDDKKLNFKVTDTGIGLTPEQRGRLFSPFSQGDLTHTKRFGGTGLGLTLARKFAQHMQGDIVLLNSVLGEGSTFLITVDVGFKPTDKLTETLWKKSSKRAGPEISDQVISLQGAKILLAEDSPDNQMIIEMILEKVGAHVDIAEDGLLAVEMALKKTYDVILMDIQLPLLDGHSACLKLRASGYQGAIIALTAHALKKERDESLQVGCNDHLTKPIDKKLLISTIKSYLH